MNLTIEQSRLAFLLFLLCCLTGCFGGSSSSHRQSEPLPSLIPVAFSDLSGWHSDNMENAVEAFLRSCEVFSQKPSHIKFEPHSHILGSYKRLDSICKDAVFATTTSPQEKRQFFEDHFIPHQVTPTASRRGKAYNDKKQRDRIFTGYFQTSLEGSFTRGGPYQYPIYALPPERARLSPSEAKLPYLTRKEIEEGALKKRGLELLWVKDPVRLFFLHVQGSGKIILPDGTHVFVGYNGKNGHPYQSIGATMIKHGYVPQSGLSAQKIQTWLRENPTKARRVMWSNRSFIFFKLLDNRGARTAMGAPVTPLRTLAIDPNYLPYGLPLWLDTQQTAPREAKSFQRLMFGQDTGSAIKGAVRGDIFFGSGQKAEYLAGHQHSSGRYYLFVPR